MVLESDTTPGNCTPWVNSLVQRWLFAAARLSTSPSSLLSRHCPLLRRALHHLIAVDEQPFAPARLVNQLARDVGARQRAVVQGLLLFVSRHHEHRVLGQGLEVREDELRVRSARGLLAQVTRKAEALHYRQQRADRKDRRALLELLGDDACPPLREHAVRLPQDFLRRLQLAIVQRLEQARRTRKEGGAACLFGGGDELPRQLCGRGIAVSRRLHVELLDDEGHPAQGLLAQWPAAGGELEAGHEAAEQTRELAASVTARDKRGVAEKQIGAVAERRNAQREGALPLCAGGAQCRTHFAEREARRLLERIIAQPAAPAQLRRPQAVLVPLHRRSHWLGQVLCAHTKRALLIRCGRAPYSRALIRDRLAERHDRCRDSDCHAGRKGRLQIAQAAL
eukprot:scaffold52654_cov75-Phaeocystis_antarctica.AAC.4